jgi:hypothetical protein
MAIVGIIDPDANAAGTLLTGAIDMSKWGRVAFIVMAGDFGTNGTLDFSVTQATTSGGSYSALSPAKAITQLTDAGTDSNKQVILEVRPEHLTEGYRYIKGNLVTATATGDSAVIALGFDPRFAPVTSDDLTTVDEIV